MSEDGVAQHLAALPRGTAFGQDGDGTFRLSLAGAQEKTAFLWHEGRWCRPQGSTPTTHIFKLPLGQLPGGIDLRTSVENEWLCMQLLRACDVPAAQVAILRFGEHTVLGVERFDRRWSPGAGWLRLPQEDFAQVFGVDPESKYEDKGGPGIQAIMQQLAGSSRADADRRDFFRTQVLFWMLAAIDGHAKNFSVFVEPRGLFHLTPRYDVLSAYPVMGTGAGQLSPLKVRMAMAVWRKNRHYRWSETRRAHFEATAADCRLRDAGLLIDELVQRTPQAIEQVRAQLPDSFPGSVAGPIFDGLSRAAAALAQPKVAVHSRQ
jgi:serine/threonine-protein kinase HipA